LRIGKAQDCPLESKPGPAACRCRRARSTAGTSEPAAWEAQDAVQTARDGAAVQVSFRNDTTVCHIPWVSLCSAVPDCWQRGRVTPSPARQPGARAGEASLGRRRPSHGGLYLRQPTGASLCPVEFYTPTEPSVPCCSAGAWDGALLAGCARTVPPEASGTDPMLLPGPLPAGKLLCSDSTMRSQSTAGK